MAPTRMPARPSGSAAGRCGQCCWLPDTRLIGSTRHAPWKRRPDSCVEFPRGPSPKLENRGRRVTQVPKPLVGGYQAFHVPPPAAVRRQRTAGEHHLKHMQQLLGDLKIALIAGLMESDHDFVGEAAAIARRRRGAGGRRFVAPEFFVGEHFEKWQHRTAETSKSR